MSFLTLRVINASITTLLMQATMRNVSAQHRPIATTTLPKLRGRRVLMQKERNIFYQHGF